MVLEIAADFGAHFVETPACFQETCLFTSYVCAAGLLSPQAYTLTLIQPGDIVCSARTVHYHKKSNTSANYKSRL